jgi:hypothetical protein
MTRFIEASSRGVQSVSIGPKPLRFHEVDSMFRLVRRRLGWIEFKLRGDK